MSEIKNLNPTCIWKNFYALTQVPRPSGHLEKVQNFLLDFAKQAGVEAFKDPADNIVMRKPASAGMENKKGVILQAHMDMVPQKTPESTHNFETDPIQPWIDGEWVKAKGTTLGADNGLGVAAIMAIMEDKTLKHGPIEALITADEETGMFGANGLPTGELNGDILLNLDSEHWGKFVIGSAGGINITATLDYKEVETDADDAAVKVTVKGLPTPVWRSTRVVLTPTNCWCAWCARPSRSVMPVWLPGRVAICVTPSPSRQRLFSPCRRRT